MKIHLQSQFLGPSCDIGSNGNPVMLTLEDDATSPLRPNQPITGSSGAFAGFNSFQGITLIGSTFVDNTLGAPGE